jgi:hypothetical protein
MIKKILICGWIFFGIFFSPKPSNAQGNTDIKVKYISAENIYLDAGSVSGLSIGDTLKVTRNEITIAKIRVNFVSEYSASCQIISTMADIKPGDFVILISEKEQSSQTLAVPVVPDSVQEKSEIESPISSRTRRRTRSPFSGIISLQYYSWNDLYETELNFTQPTLRISLRGRQLWGKAYNLRIRARLRHNQRSRPLNSNAPEREWRNRIYEVSFSYDDANAAFNYQMGRIISNKFSGIGYIDGLLLQYKMAPKIRAGLFGGAQPQWQYGNFQSSIQKYGGYINYLTGDFNTNRFESTLALAGEYHGSTVSREFIYFQNNLYLLKTWTIFQSAEVDINRDWREEISGEKIALTNLYVSAQWNLTRRLIIGLMYDNRKNYLTYETRTYVEDLFDEALRQGFRGSINLILPQNYRIFANAGIRKRESDVETTKSIAGGLSKVNFLIPNLRVFINAAGFSNFYTDGFNYSLLIGRYIGNQINLDLGYGGYQYSLKADNKNRTNQWVRLNAMGDLIANFFWYGQYEYNWGVDLKGHRILLEIGYRF